MVDFAKALRDKQPNHIMEEPVLKTSKCLSCDIVKGSQPFKSGDELPGEPLRGRLYEALFATGDKAYIKGTDDRQPLYVGEPGKEWFYAFRLVPKKRADNSYILTIEVDRTFEPGEKMPLKKSKLADGSAAAAIAAQVPGVKLASELPTGKIAPSEPIAEPATAPKVTGTPEEKVAPALRQPTKSFADTAKDTVKLTPEQLRAEAAKPVTPAIPDNQPRKGVVKSVTTNVADNFVVDGTTQHKYVVTMEDGTVGNIWSTETAAPVKPKDEVNYTLSGFSFKGTPYKDGSKRIDIIQPGMTAVSKEVQIMRMACSRDAIAFMTMRGYGEDVPLDALFALHKDISERLEAHILRPIE